MDFSGTSVLSVKNLSKYYGSFCAVNNLSFELKEGQILGLLGPNGAGKSTTIQMLLGLTTPDSGSIEVFGKAYDKHRTQIAQHINFGSTYTQVQGRLSVWQNLRIYAGLYQVKNYQKRISELLELMEISHLKDMQFWKLSSGQKTRALLAKALINRPKILFLDEPTASLDPDIILKIIELIQRLRTEYGTSVLYTSHNMEEVARLCDEAMFMHSGNLVLRDSPERLSKLIDESTLRLTFEGEHSVVQTLSNELGHKPTFPKASVVSLRLKDEEIPKILFLLQKKGVLVTHIDIDRPTLEDVFVHLSQKGTDGLV